MRRLYFLGIWLCHIIDILEARRNNIWCFRETWFKNNTTTHNVWQFRCSHVKHFPLSHISHSNVNLTIRSAQSTLIRGKLCLKASSTSLEFVALRINIFEHLSLGLGLNVKSLQNSPELCFDLFWSAFDFLSIFPQKTLSLTWLLSSKQSLNK